MPTSSSLGFGYSTHNPDPEEVGVIMAQTKIVGRTKITKAAKVLRMHPQTLLSKVRSGRVRALKIGARFYIEYKEILRYLTDGDLPTTTPVETGDDYYG